MHSNSVPRRRHTDEFKAKVLSACAQPGASISGIALAHGLNANLVRKWRSGRGVKPAGAAVELPANAAPGRPMPLASPLVAANPEFVALEMPSASKAKVSAGAGHADAAATAAALIHVELRRGALQLSVRWPTTAADDCTAWLRELTKGLLK